LKGNDITKLKLTDLAYLIEDGVKDGEDFEYLVTSVKEEEENGM